MSVFDKEQSSEELERKIKQLELERAEFSFEREKQQEISRKREDERLEEAKAAERKDSRKAFFFLMLAAVGSILALVLGDIYEDYINKKHATLIYKARDHAENACDAKQKNRLCNISEEVLITQKGSQIQCIRFSERTACTDEEYNKYIKENK